MSLCFSTFDVLPSDDAAYDTMREDEDVVLSTAAMISEYLMTNPW